jgi:hypothetical protein
MMFYQVMKGPTGQSVVHFSTRSTRAARSVSMRHQVKDDVDAKGIGHLLGEFVEVEFVLTLPFPTIADIAVVDGKNHDPLVVVEQSPDVRFLGAFATVDPLER